MADAAAALEGAGFTEETAVSGGAMGASAYSNARVHGAHRRQRRHRDVHGQPEAAVNEATPTPHGADRHLRARVPDRRRSTVRSRPWGIGQEIRIGEVVIPWGLVAALVGVLALLVGIRLVAGGRWVAAAAAVGVVGTVALLTLPGRGGSVLVAGDVIGTIWAVGPALIAVLVVAWPKLPERRTAPVVGA